MKENSASIHVQTPVDVAAFLLNEKRGEILKIETRHRVTVIMIPNKHLETPHYKLERIKQDDPRLEDMKSSYSLAEEAETDIGYGTRQKEEIKPRQEAVVKGITPDQPAPIVERKPVAVEQPVLTASAGDNLISKFFGWLRGLVAAPATETAAPAAVEKPQQRERGDRGDRNGNGRRRRRGGRERSEEREATAKDETREAAPAAAKTETTRPPREPKQNQRGERGQRQPREDRKETAANAKTAAKQDEELLKPVAVPEVIPAAAILSATEEPVPANAADESVAPETEGGEQGEEQRRRRRRRGGRNRNRRDRENGEAVDAANEGEQAEADAEEAVPALAVAAMATEVAAASVEQSAPAENPVPAVTATPAAEQAPATQLNMFDTQTAAPAEAPVTQAAPVAVQETVSIEIDSAPVPANTAPAVEEPVAEAEEVVPAAPLAEATPSAPVEAETADEVQAQPVETEPAEIKADAAEPVPAEAARAETETETIPQSSSWGAKPNSNNAGSAMQVEQLQDVLAAAGLTLASTDPEKLRAVQEAAAQVVPQARVPRERKPAPQVANEPLVQVETRH